MSETIAIHLLPDGRVVTPGDVIVSEDDAHALRELLRFIFALHVYDPTPDEIAAGAEPPTDFPGMVHGRTFPDWLAMLDSA